MPRDFTMTLNHTAISEHSCREGAADTFCYRVRDNAKLTFASVAMLPCTMTLRFQGTIDPDALVALLHTACAFIRDTPISVSCNPALSWSGITDVCIEGTTANVYHAMWWCALLTRLALTEGIAATPELQIGTSRLIGENWYGSEKSYYRDQALSAYARIAEIDAVSMFSHCRGPGLYFNYRDIGHKDDE